MTTLPQNDIREIVSCKKEQDKIIGVKVRILKQGGSERYMALKEINEEQAKHASVKPTFKPVYTLKIEDMDRGYHSAFVYVEKFGNQYEIREIRDKVPNALRNLQEISS